MRWQRLITRWASRFRRPTPASQILPVVTRVVTLPTLSALAGRRIRVRIGVAPEATLSALFDKSLLGATAEEGLRRVKNRSPDQLLHMNRKAEEAIQALLQAAILDPPIAPFAGGLPAGAIPYEAIEGDRFFLIKDIAVLTLDWRRLCKVLNASLTAAPAQTAAGATEIPQAESVRDVPGQPPSK